MRQEWGQAVRLVLIRIRVGQSDPPPACGLRPAACLAVLEKAFLAARSSCHVWWRLVDFHLLLWCWLLLLLLDWMSARYGQLWRQRAGADLRGWIRSLEYYTSTVLVLPHKYLWIAGAWYCSTIFSDRFRSCLDLYT